MNSTQIPLTTEKPNPAAWKHQGLTDGNDVLYQHIETGEQLRYRMQPKPLLKSTPPPTTRKPVPLAPELSADEIIQALIDDPTHAALKRRMRTATKNRRLSVWAKRAGVHVSWCGKFARGELPPRADWIIALLRSDQVLRQARSK